MFSKLSTKPDACPTLPPLEKPFVNSAICFEQQELLAGKKSKGKKTKKVMPLSLPCLLYLSVAVFP